MTAVDLAASVREILDAGVEAVRAEACVGRALRSRDVSSWLDGIGNGPLDVIAVGKAAGEMARVFVARLEGQLVPQRVLVVSPFEVAASPAALETEVISAEHPLPGDGGELAAERVEQWVEAGAGKDLVFLLSGGASSLLPAPSEGFRLQDKIVWSDRLMRAGADIHQLNTVRAQMSRLKAGRLALRSNYDRVLVLLVSDVVGDDLSIIGSGPWFPSSATGAAAADVVLRVLGSEGQPLADQLRRTPDPPSASHPCFERVRHVICGGGRTALDAMQKAAMAHPAAADGLIIHCWGPHIDGEARRVARRLVRNVLKAWRSTQGGGPAVWLGSGETTVTVRGDGVGGRNQELALCFALEWELQAGSSDPPRFVFASLGSDGCDGPTPAAGAMVDENSLRAMCRAGVDPASSLEQNDSHHALSSIRGTITTGPTGTNVGDLMVCCLA